MEDREPCYLCIDLKSYYASVECVQRGLDPLTANLVVADESRSDKTICLAVTPSLKAMGIPGRPRLFEVKQRLKEIHRRTGKEVPLVIAPPQMAKYLDISAKIYGIYLEYLAPEDIHAYSVDEVFMDISRYRQLYPLSPRQLAGTMIRDVLSQTGITATAGIGCNLYLAKVAMDIVAKHCPPDQNGVRIAQLNEQSYRETLWEHEPLTDFWMIGPGTSQRLLKMGVHTMGDLAKLSLQNQQVLFRIFGVDAEILIDHAWGLEPCGMEQIKSYRPAAKSITSGQVLPRGYSFPEGCLIVREMAEQVALELVEKGFVAQGVTLYVGYEALGKESASCHVAVKQNHFGKTVPVSVHGTAKLPAPTAAISQITKAAVTLYRSHVDPQLQVRRLHVCAIRLLPEDQAMDQLDLFSQHHQEERERGLMKAMLAMHRKYGKNALIKGQDLLEGATTIERNGQIGGHRA